MRKSAQSLPAIAPGIAFLCFAVPAALGQQFQQVTSLPTIAGATARWSEGVECADVDKDGDLDIFLADGDGFSSAGVQRQNGLIINKLIEIGAWNFADESVARLGVGLSNAKQVTTGDVDGDTWVDALFANAWNTDTPFLYMNRGAAQPGFFDMESAIRGFTTNLSSGGACFADLDNDGDLDVILADAYFTSGVPRLFFNDGSGVFTENAAALNAPTKSHQQDVQFTDIDNDWDLDFVGLNRGANASGTHYLMLNDGFGNFTNASATLGTTGSSVYEADVGDLDGDTDADLFFVSLSGFAEGVVRNNLVPNGTLSFTNQATFGGSDDNEVAFCDYDNDGDYDVLVGSLGASEVLYTNNGALSFANSGQVQAQADSSLDCTFADLNNDGAYEIITAQGESGNFTDKYYRNTGAADTLPPVVIGIDQPASSPATGPVVVRAEIRDQVLDDGVNYVTGTATYVIHAVPPTAAVSINAGGVFSPSSVNVTAGTTVTWTNNSGGSQRVSSTTAPYAYDSGTIANGGTYSHTFIGPTTYAYTNTFSATNGQVVVGGSATTVAATYSGGQIYRFRMNDTAGGTGTQLCFELSFSDWPGNVSVTDSGCVSLGGAVGTPSCIGFSNGACPCAPGLNPGAGCGNESATTGHGGSLLDASLLSGTSPSVSADAGTPQVQLNMSLAPPGKSAIFLQGTMTIAPTFFYDGLRCTGGSLVRLNGATPAGDLITGGGTLNYPNATHPQSIVDRSASLGQPIASSETRHYFVQHRIDAAPNACIMNLTGNGNTTNALTIVWGP